MKKRIAVVGGGASGCAILWALAQRETRDQVELTLFHDEDEVGGHSKTIEVWFDGAGRGHAVTAEAPAPPTATVYPVDIGVQFVCPTLYPNLYKQLGRPEFAGAVPLVRHPALRLSGSFGPTLNWGNFPEYQSGPRFEGCYDTDTRARAEKFQHDVNWGPLTPLDGLTFATSVERYLETANVPWSTNFFRYLLIPYLSIINGYGTGDLLETTFEDLFPIFTKIPGIQHAGPYGNFLSPGTGWDRFEKGSTSWVMAMATYASTHGASVRNGHRVRAVTPLASGKVRLEWVAASESGWDEFDEVVLTTDMTTNRALLDNPGNALYATQKDYIREDSFALIPGTCYIHQDDECLSPHLRDKKEDGQFVGAYAWGKQRPGGNFYGLPYDLEASFQTYLMKNILGTPVDCHVSMYAKDVTAKTPAEDKIIWKREWLHGRWVASFFDQAKRQLHRIQGLGHVWFAGNNTTVDSEEGALLSGMIVANKLCPEFVYPFEMTSEAYLFYRYFANTMFPAPSLPWQLGQVVNDAEERVQKLFDRSAR
jgi:NAD(P)-binding Rossmann-like domain